MCKKLTFKIFKYFQNMSRLKSFSKNHENTNLNLILLLLSTVKPVLCEPWSMRTKHYMNNVFKKI